MFGWGYQEGVPFARYWFFRTSPNDGGAYTLDAEPSDNGLALVVAVEDIPETLRKIEGAGGVRFCYKPDTGNEMGFFAYFLDPAGNKMGLWSKT